MKTTVKHSSIIETKEKRLERETIHDACGKYQRINRNHSLPSCETIKSEDHQLRSLRNSVPVCTRNLRGSRCFVAEVARFRHTLYKETWGPTSRSVWWHLKVRREGIDRTEKGERQADRERERERVERCEGEGGNEARGVRERTRRQTNG